MKKLLGLAVAGLFVMSAAQADFTGKNAAGNTITFKNSVDCTVGTCVPLFQLGDGTNTAAINTAGADGASNTASGAQVYARPSWFNGTTWDRAPGTTNGGFMILRDAAGNARGANVDASNRLTTAPSMVSGSVASGAFASGSIASGAVASGAVASGAFASGSIATGAMVDVTTNGATTAHTCSTGGYSVLGCLGQIDDDVKGPVPAGTNLIGKITPNDGTNSMVFDPCQTVAKTYVPINISTAVSTKIVTKTSAKKTYVCSLFLLSAGTQNVALIEGTKTTNECDTSTAGMMGGTTAATGQQLTAQVGFVLPGTGYAQAATANQNFDVCLITSAAVQLSGVAVVVQQ